MQIVCPQCCSQFPIEAGLVEGDGKRLAALLAGVDPELGRAVLRYLRFFKPAKTALRLVRAHKIASELIDLVQAGSVAVLRDRRATTASMWIRAIEQMESAEAERALRLPLSSNGYLCKVVFGIADSEEGKAERAREEQLRKGAQRGTGDRRLEYQDRLQRVDADVRLKLLTAVEGDRKKAAIRQEFGMP